MVRMPIPKCSIDALVYFAYQNMERKEKRIRRNLAVDLMDELCEQFNVKKTDITGTSRLHKIVMVRFVFCYVLRKEFGWSYSAIGNEINRDHTTIVYACSAARDNLKTLEPFFCNLYFQFLKETKLLTT